MSVERFCQTVETKMKGGLLSVVVLHIIGAADPPIHGYLLTKTLETLTEGTLRIQAGTLYPILKSLENHGLIKHEMVRSTEGPPRKTYRLTHEGAGALKRVVPIMDDLFTSIGKVREADWNEIIQEASEK